MTTRGHPVGAPLARRVLIVVARVMLVLAGASLLLAAALSAWLLTGGSWQPPGGQEAPAVPSVVPPTTPAPGITAVKSPATATLMPTESALDTPPAPTIAGHVGIVAGHAGYDPGAVCADGLTEAEVNLAIATIVVELLGEQGYQVDLLDEFDDRLPGYRADALVSIHADSCQVPGASGFKVARITDSAIPEAEDRLVDCLYRQYEAITGLPRHPNSITDNMTNYHAFREIDSYTPGAIIETGFLLEDQPWIVRRPRLAAGGITAGVICFLKGAGQE